ncbi:MAG: hypothetical protein OEM52_09370 [bacterium]|nr:hypothetical protein [bacterium]
MRHKNIYDEGKSFAETFLHRADRLLAIGKMRLDLTAARQRLDRALLSLAEETYRQANERNVSDALPLSSIQRELERVRAAIMDRDRIQIRIDDLKKKMDEEE